MDLISTGNTGAAANVILHAVKERKSKDINIIARLECIGKREPQILVGLHTFTGEDHGGKIVASLMVQDFFCLES